MWHDHSAHRAWSMCRPATVPQVGVSARLAGSVGMATQVAAQVAELD